MDIAIQHRDNRCTPSMTARYSPAALLSTLLHALAVGLLVLVSMPKRDETSAAPKLIGSVFNVVNAAWGQSAETGITVPVSAIPVRPASSATVESPVDRMPSPDGRLKPKSDSVRQPKNPPRNQGPKSNPPNTTRSSVSPRINENWILDPKSNAHFAPGPAIVNGGGNPAATEIDDYFAELRGRLWAALRLPPSIGEGLIAKVEFMLGSDGTLSRPRILVSSGSDEFDRAVLDAIARTRMRARPDGKSEAIVVPFRTRGDIVR
jgi:TonB family protein